MPTSGICKLFVEGIFKIWLTRLIYSYFLLAFFKMSWCPGSAPYFWLGYIVNEVSSVPIRFWNYISQFSFFGCQFKFSSCINSKTWTNKIWRSSTTLRFPSPVMIWLVLKVLPAMGQHKGQRNNKYIVNCLLGNLIPKTN